MHKTTSGVVYFCKLLIITLLFCMRALAICGTSIKSVDSNVSTLRIELKDLRSYMYKHQHSSVLYNEKYKSEYNKICSAAVLLKIPCSRIKLSTKPTGVSLAGVYIFINIDEFIKLTFQQLIFTLGHEWAHIHFKHGETQLIAYLKAELMACPKCFSKKSALEIALNTACQRNSVFREQSQVNLRWEHELEADAYAVGLMISAGIVVNVDEIVSDLALNSMSDISGTSTHPPLEIRRVGIVQFVRSLCRILQ